jgi:hypothetical protein
MLNKVRSCFFQHASAFLAEATACPSAPAYRENMMRTLGETPSQARSSALPASRGCTRALRSRRRR